MYKQIFNRNAWRKICLSVCVCTVCAFSLLAQQPLSVSGRVSDANGELLPGVNVTVKGTTTGVISNNKGEYTITVPHRDAVLSFSFVGYASQDIAVDGRTNIAVTLVESSTEMEEVVVVGYGTQKKENLSGAVSTISA
jgi:hypothetical protein